MPNFKLLYFLILIMCCNLIIGQNNGGSFGGTTRKSRYGEQDIYRIPPRLEIVSDSSAYISNQTLTFLSKKDTTDYSPVFIENKNSFQWGRGRHEKKPDSSEIFLHLSRAYPAFAPKLEHKCTNSGFTL